MSIHFMRHGKDLNPTPDRITADDVGLDEQGKFQAVTCAEKIAQKLVDRRHLHIVTSPRKRTVEAARLVAAYLHLGHERIEIDVRLAERDMQALAGQLFSQVFSLRESELIAKAMEPFDHFYGRTKTLYDNMLTMYPDAPVLLVGHSGTVRPLLQVANDVPPTANLEIEMFAPDSFITIHQ